MKTKRGRPFKTPEDCKTAELRIRLTSAERAMLDSFAGGKTSTWARETLLNAAKRRLKG